MSSTRFAKGFSLRSMPRPDNLVETEITVEGGYFPSVPDLSPKGAQNTINAGSSVWLRPRGKVEVAKGLIETSVQNVGARIFAADIQRATIAGGLVGSRLPYAGLLRYQNAVLFFLSENTGSQVYLDEVAASGVTTASSAGRLRIAVPDGVGGYNTFDAGFDKPVITTSSLNPAFGIKDMKGAVGISLSRWRSKTNAWGPPANIIYFSLAPNTNTTIGITLPAEVSGQDGWIVSGTRWGDRSGTLRIYRYVYKQPRGTFTATNGSPNLTLGVGTRWTLDLRQGDGVIIDGGAYSVTGITADGAASIFPNFAGATNSGKTMTIQDVNSEWYDGELRGIVNPNIQKPPRAAGVLQYGGRVFIWGVGDTINTGATLPTGPVILAMEDDNPEHVGLLGIVTASGSDLVNVLAGDGPMYLMTTTGLEVVNFTGGGDTPYVIRVVAEPGFKAATNGVLYKDWFYGFNTRPLRTRAENNIDVKFAEPVWSDMRSWDSTRVMLAVDPDNEAVLYIFDDGNITVAIPWMTQQELWGPPINFAARIIDSQVVNGKLYVTYLNGGVYRVQQWEGGSGIGGTRYIASQFLDPNYLKSSRLKTLGIVAKAGSLSVYPVTPAQSIPDVTNLGAAAVTFPLSDTATREPDIRTNVAGDAYAFRVDFASNDGSFDKLVIGGLPRGYSG